MTYTTSTYQEYLKQSCARGGWGWATSAGDAVYAAKSHAKGLEDAHVVWLLQAKQLESVCWVDALAFVLMGLAKPE